MESESVWEQEAAEIAEHIRNGNGAQLVQMLYMAQIAVADFSSDLLQAELDVKLAEAIAYNEGKVVGANAEARAASAMGFTAAKRKHVIECKTKVALNEAIVESLKEAIKIVAFRDNSWELEKARQDYERVLNELTELSAKYDALEATIEEMDGQLSDEQRKFLEGNDGF
jgi:flagellar motility protein MotE (MotC chaperone)